MIYKFEDKKIKKLLEKRKELFDKMNKVNKEISDKDAERKKIAFQMERSKEKVGKLLKRHYKDDIKVNSPIEIVSVVKLDGGLISVEVANLVDDYTQALIKQHKEKK